MGDLVERVQFNRPSQQANALVGSTEFGVYDPAEPENQGIVGLKRQRSSSALLCCRPVEVEALRPSHDDVCHRELWIQFQSALRRLPAAGVSTYRGDVAIICFEYVDTGQSSPSRCVLVIFSN